MVMIKEYRVVLPLTVEEYQVGQLYAVAKASKRESNSDNGVEILKNEPYENAEGKGQYTYKIYHLGSRLPGWVRALMPSSLLQVHEEAWNAYPHCKTVLTSPFMGSKFQIVVETRHCADRGHQENAHNLSPELLKKRVVEPIDIAFDSIEKKDYNKAEDPQLFRSEKTGRGPLATEWKSTVEPVMCAYKLVTAEVKIFGLQGKIEVFCWLDEWIGLTMADIRRMEDEAKAELAKIYADKAASSSQAAVIDESALSKVDPATIEASSSN